MSTPNASRRRQPERNAKTRTAKEQMGQRKLKHGMHSAIPNSYYLAIAQRNAQESALLRLPAEIRHRIWTYAVHVQTVTMGDLDWMDRKDYPKQSVLQVCRQVHAETCLLPYSNNSFWIYDIVSLSVWLTRRLPEQIAAVQRIEISCCECSEAPLRLLTGMKHIIVYCICDGLCPTDPARSKAIKEALGGSWGNFDFKIRIVQG